MDNYYLGAYWHGRKEKLDTIINKSILFLNKLSEIDKSFLHWYKEGYNCSEANEIEINYAFLEKMYKSKLKNGDIDKNGYSKVGFRISGWSGHQDDFLNTSFSIAAGDDFIKIPNSCIVSIPHKGEEKKRLLEINIIKKILKEMIIVWKPDYAVLQSQKLKDVVKAKNLIGWVTYYDKRFNLPKLPDAFSIEEVKGFGSIIHINTTFDVNEQSLTNELLNLKSILGI